MKRGGKVCTKIIPEAYSATLCPIIERKVVPDSTIYTDTWRGYNALDVTDFKHYRINHSLLFADKQNHINRCLAGDARIAEKGIEKLLGSNQASYAQIKWCIKGLNNIHRSYLGQSL